MLGRGDGLGVVQGLGVEIVALRRLIEVFVVADGGGNAVELETDAGSAGPSIGRGRVAFDLAAATAFARAHD
jgi:hypothetical protein